MKYVQSQPQRHQNDVINFVSLVVSLFQKRAFCNMKSVPPFPVFLPSVQPLCVNLVYLRPCKTKKSWPFLSDQTLLDRCSKTRKKTLPDIITFPFYQTSLPNSCPKFMKNNITILSVLTDENSLRTLFYWVGLLNKLRKVRICHKQGNLCSI